MFGNTSASSSLWRRAGTLLALLILALSAMARPAAAQGSWSARAPMPTARAVPGAATGLDGRIYVFGGGNNTELATAEAYDPNSNTWATLTPMPTARHGLGVARGSDGRIYAIGGYSNNVPGQLNTVEAYDPSTNTWSTMTPMPTARVYSGTTTGLDGRIYVIGGTDNGAHELSTVEAYDPGTDTWSTLASMPTARDALVAVTGVDGRIYAIGGLDRLTYPYPYKGVNTVEAYDPGTNTWRTLASMSTPRNSLAGAIGPDGRIYVCGGATSAANSSVLSSVEAYDPQTNTWSPVASMPMSRANLAGATGLDGRIYAIGGSDATGSNLSTVEAFTVPAPVILSSLTLSPSTVPGCKPSTGKVTLNKTTAVPILVTLAGLNPAAHVPPSVTVPAGKISATFQITTDVVTSSVTGAIKATLGSITKSANLTVRPISVKTLQLVPSAIIGGNNAAGVVTLECPAAPTDITVTLSSNNPAVANPLVGSVTIPAGKTSFAFTIHTNPVAASTVVSLKAAANGLFKSANLTVRPPGIASLTLVPSSVNSGENVVGVVILDSVAGPGGKTITLSSSNPSVASPDVGSITIPEGDSIGYFNISTSTVSVRTTLTIKAVTGLSTRSATLTVNP